MRLNPDCIRDILLSVEASTDLTHCWSFDAADGFPEPLNKYPTNEVLYHISQCRKSNLVDGCSFCLGATAGTINDLSPYGHQFLADIRSDNVWNNVKEVSKKVGSNSIQAISQIATGVITEIIKAQLGLH